jgi:hypothetical protein
MSLLGRIRRITPTAPTEAARQQSESVVGAVRQQAEDTTEAVRGATKTDK